MDPSTNGSREQRLVENEKAFRNYNDRRMAFEAGAVLADEELPFVCECGASACHAVIMLTADEFEAAHASPAQFAVSPHHVAPDLERVLERRSGYWVIEKLAPVR